MVNNHNNNHHHHHHHHHHRGNIIQKGHKKELGHDNDIYKKNHYVHLKEVVNVYDLGYMAIE